MNERKAEVTYAHLKEKIPQKLSFNPVRIIQDIRVSEPRICPECIKETGIDWHWSLLPAYQCIKHARKLIEACPNCHSKLRWHYEIFTHCHQCKTKWSDLKPENEEINFFQRELYAIKQECSQTFLDKVDDVALATMITARPFDSMYQSLQCVRKQATTIELVEKAYRLLCDTEYYNAWVTEVKIKRAELKSASEKAQLLPIKYFELMRKAKWAEKSTSHCLHPINHEHLEFIRPFRRNISTPDSHKFQCKHSALAEILGIRRTELNTLIDTGAICSLNNPALVRDQVFDIRTSMNT
jgi:hypothetical protein